MGAERGGGRARLASVSDGDAREACGVFGVFAPGKRVAHLTYLGLYALQHRGQESAGMAVADGDTLTVVKDMGLVPNVFDDRTLVALTGDLAIGHTRYSTTGSSTWRNAQPVYRDSASQEFALGHNGNLTNTEALADEAGMLPGIVSSDSDLMAELLAQHLADKGGDLVRRAGGGAAPCRRAPSPWCCSTASGCTASATPTASGRSAWGDSTRGWVLASETPALDIVGATFVRELEPGEVVVIDRDGPRSLHPFAPERIQPRLCVFEFVYFARPDAQLYGRNVDAARVRMGERLAAEAPLPPDRHQPARPAMVMPVPESGGPAAQGFARASGIPYGDGLVKNRYIGRTFIAPSQDLRALGVRLKLNPLRENIEGKRLVVVDDSIVRGTTTRAVVAMLRESGAAEVHLRIMSPPYRWPCFFGMDTGDPDELLAASLDVDEIRAFVDADSLAYLSLDGLMQANDVEGAPFCDACLTGNYPVEVPVTLHKAVLEAR